jgi:chromosome segregation ATPase
MSIKTNDRLDEMRQRIDALRARAQAADAKIERLNAAAEATVEQLDARLKAVEHALAAELAENREDLNDAMDAYVDDFWELSRALRPSSATRLGQEREQSEAAIRDLRRGKLGGRREFVGRA